jgi:hypothetical protein
LPATLIDQPFNRLTQGRFLHSLIAFNLQIGAFAGCLPEIFADDDCRTFRRLGSRKLD